MTSPDWVPVELQLIRIVDEAMQAEWIDDESSVLFDERSGETLLLNLVERSAFTCLNEPGTAISFEEWVRRTALALDVSVDQPFRTYLLNFLDQLEQIGLVRSLRP